jgi:Ca-activated chloride channel family protein
MTIRTATATLGLALLMTAAAWAQGIVIPNEPDLPPLALQRHDVRVEIVQQAAVTTVEQVFRNHTDRKLEAQYVFPLPKGAAVSKFSMRIDGKEVSGEIVDKARARHLYNSLVSRTQEPGLLEALGSDLFRASIYPIPAQGTQKVTLRYEQVLLAQDSLVAYTYPVRTGTTRGPAVQGEFTLDVSIRNAIPVSNVYSPTHPILVTRNGEREARAVFKDRQTTLEKDFQLYFSVSDQEVGLNLAASRPDPKQPGAFMLLLSPRHALEAERIVERDVVFVVDTSGSMAGEKFKQAMNALRYCVTKLHDKDRFAVVRFSSYAEPWKKDLVPAAEGRKGALAWIDTLMAEGGTDIAGALDAALAYPRSPERPYVVIFMTDGKPTLGETTKANELLAKIHRSRAAAAGENVRLFSWGVGYDVDTQLLDGMASVGSGVSEYVHPQEDIAVKVAAFASKASHPVLTGLKLEVVGEKVQLVNLQPRVLPDLYAGSQLVLFGRYTGDGDVALRLTGKVNGKSQTFTYETKFPAAENGNGFIEPLWARRRIGDLLDQIRLHGETKELVDDVVRLSTEYGVQTPYTSFLILDDGTRLGAGVGGGRSLASNDPRQADKNRARDEKLADTLSRAPKPAAEPPKAAPAAPPAEEQKAHNELAKTLQAGFGKKDGKESVDASVYLRKLRESDQAGEGRMAQFRRANNQRYLQYRGVWLDDRFEAEQQVTAVRFASAAYFRILELHPELVETFKLGTSVLAVTAAGKAVVVSIAAGEETLPDEKIEELFKPLARAK